MYETAMLWSIKELITQYKKIFGSKFNLYISPWTYSVSAIDIPKNCGKCDKELTECIEEYNKNFNADNFKDINCSCIEKWNQRMSVINQNAIPDRIIKNLSHLKNN